MYLVLKSNLGNSIYRLINCINYKLREYNTLFWFNVQCTDLVFCSMYCFGILFNVQYVLLCSMHYLWMCLCFGVVDAYVLVFWIHCVMFVLNSVELGIMIFNNAQLNEGY
ncbi:hypothetical protein Lalb_Chr17g0335541 [Lupinus albus]|uniref:Uncharacterized protein n=1 Tax=Lupinus albus TaxID=3870 RepID=A0A6A4NN66_LUPAL|nr:hypothetical protein Lalb_Chr17g0335541 [Lupinus albus]